MKLDKINPIEIFPTHSYLELFQSKSWRTDCSIFFFKSKSSKLNFKYVFFHQKHHTYIRMTLLISSCFSPTMSAPHPQPQNKPTQNKKVRLAKFSMTQLIGHYRISQREDAETSPPSCCLVPFGSLSKCPFALCSSSKNRG